MCIRDRGRPVSEMDIQEAEIVVYVISRISGEGKDRRLEKGDYCLLYTSNGMQQSGRKSRLARGKYSEK